MHLIVLWPAILIAVRYGFETLAITRSFVRLEIVLVNLLLMYFVLKITPINMLKNVFIPIIASILVALLAFYLKGISQTTSWQIISVLLCALVYFIVVLIFPSERKAIFSFKDKNLG